MTRALQEAAAVDLWSWERRHAMLDLVPHSKLAWERLLPLALLGATAVGVPYLVWSDAGLPKLERLRAERASVLEKSSRLELSIRQLRSEVERVKNDPASVERTARDELGLVRQTEVVFQFQR